MPTYTYRCSNCGEFELAQSIREDALEFCPVCEAPVRRVVTGGTGFILRGGSPAPRTCDRETPCCGRSVRCDKPPCTDE